MQWLVQTQGENLTQGTILHGVDFGYGEYNPLCIVLSNACDFEHDKLSFVLLAVLDPAKETLENSKEVKALIGENGIEGMTKKSKEALLKLYSEKINNKTIGRYYFMDPKPVIDMDPLLVDFQHVISFDYDKLKAFVDNGKIVILGRMNHPFVEQMMLQYVGYTGRVPSDRVTPEEEAELAKTLMGLK